MPRTKKIIKKEYTHAVGRRKEAVARVRLFSGKGQTTINEKPIGKYFSGRLSQTIFEKPFRIADVLGKYYATIHVAGGGVAGQLEAVVHGLSRALAKIDHEKTRVSLKKEGLLTRDARTRQRRMIGTGGKSRRQKQSPKR